MKGRSITLFRFILWAWDIISLNIILWISALRVIPAFSKNKDFQLTFAVMNLSWLFCVYITALYLSKNWLDIEGFLKRTLQCFVLNFIIIMIFVYPYEYASEERIKKFVMVSLLGFSAVLVLNRFIFFVILEYLRKQREFAKKVIVLGYNDISKRLMEYFLTKSKMVDVIGCFEDPERVHELSFFPIIGNLKESLSFAVDNQVNEIYSTISLEKYPDLY